MACEEDYDKKGRVVTEGDIYFLDLTGFAIHNITVYECAKCSVTYFGGMQDCSQAMQSEDKLNKEDLMCKKCTTEELGFGKEICEEHGNEFVDWKCMYCCSLAVYYCISGNGIFCQPCHNDAMNGGAIVKTGCEGGTECQLGIQSHPKADKDAKKSRYPLGCSLCRSQKIALIQTNDQASAGVNLERRDDMVKRFDHVKGHDIAREMRV